jgi:hypothetical protein
MKNRCDGNIDCPDDNSDEQNCIMFTTDNTYRKTYSPTKERVKVNVSIHIQSVSNIKELDMEFDVRLRVKFKWFDQRVTFRNLKTVNKMNIVNLEDMGKLWLPYLSFKNSLHGEMTKVDQQTLLVVKKMSNPRYVDYTTQNKGSLFLLSKTPTHNKQSTSE